MGYAIFPKLKNYNDRRAPKWPRAAPSFHSGTGSDKGAKRSNQQAPRNLLIAPGQTHCAPPSGWSARKLIGSNR